MQQKVLFSAYSIADRIDLVSCQSENKENLISKSSIDLFYGIADTGQMYLLSYGVVVFSGMEQYQIEDQLRYLSKYSIRPKTKITSDSLEVQFLEHENHLEPSFDLLNLGRSDHAVRKMIMLHLGQSVALDHYNSLSQSILSEIKAYTLDLQVHGKVKLSQKKALKFIGKNLNTKNNIAENLYILDSPEVAWEDEYLDRLHTALVRHFELTQRNREIDNTLKIIEDNLSIYMSYNHHRESSRLEWIIIILIVIEVLDTFISKMF